MEITIALSKGEERTLTALIDLMVKSGLENYLFVTRDKIFLDTHEWNIQNSFKINGILEWYDNGCESVKFKFTVLGLGVIKNYQPEIFHQLKPLLPFRCPSLSVNCIPNVKVKILKEKSISTS